MYQYLVKMKFSFDSIQVLFDEKNLYTELFTASKKGLRGDADPKYYQILLKFGWKMNDKFPDNLNIHKNELASFVEGSHGELYINYVKDVLNIQEDGSVDLDVEYIGSLESEARNPYVINIIEPGTVQEIKRLDNIIKETENTLTTRYKGLQILKEYDDTTGKIDDIELRLPDLDAALGDTKDITDQEKDLVSILQQSIDKKNELEKDSKDAFIKKILTQLEKMYQYPGGYRVTPAGWIKGTIPFLRVEGATYQARKKYLEQFDQDIINNTFDKDTLKNLINSSYATVDSQERFDSFDNQQGGWLNVRDYYDFLFIQRPVQPIGPTSTVATLSDMRIIRYFTFGALLKALALDSSFLIVGCDVPISSFDFNSKSSISLNAGISANELYIYTKYKQISLKDPDNSIVYEYKINQKNIFDLPISMSTFKNWFTNHITSSDRYHMSLISFLNTCINDLLPSIVQPTNNSYYPLQNLKFKYHLDRVLISEDNPLLKSAEKTDMTGIPYFDAQRSSSPFDFINNIQSTSTDKKKEVNFIMFYCVPKYFKRKRSYENDFITGIPSFYYGNKNSIINKISFKENTIPYLKEAAIQKQVEGTTWKPGIFLRGLYNVTLESMGVTYFRPGSVFYVSPTFTGVKDISQPISLGIGGYFMLVSIKMIIESGKFITTLEGIWLSTGDGNITDLSGSPLKVFRTKPLPEGETPADSIQTEGAFSAN